MSVHPTLIDRMETMGAIKRKRRRICPMAGRTLSNPSAIPLELHGRHVIIGNNRSTVGLNRPFSMGAAMTGLTENPPMTLAQTVKNLSATRGLV